MRTRQHDHNQQVGPRRGYTKEMVYQNDRLTVYKCTDNEVPIVTYQFHVTYDFKTLFVGLPAEEAVKVSDAIWKSVPEEFLPFEEEGGSEKNAS